MSRSFKPENYVDIAHLLAEGGIGVLRTDTIYGVVASAHDTAAVERLYRVRGRDSGKPIVVLIGDESQIWDSRITAEHHQMIERYWPGKVSIILPAGDATEHIHRGFRSIAYRLPADQWLRQLLLLSGPLAAPSANPQGLPPAADVTEAQAYFGDSVDFYVNQGRVEDASPSQLLRLEDDGTITRLR